MTQSAWVEVPFEVQKPQEGLRVDAYLALRLHRYSRAEVQRMISGGRVFLRGRAAKPAARVRPGETVTIRYPRLEEPPPTCESLSVLFEDDWLLAVNKPAGVLSHPTDKISANCATTILRRQFPGLRLHLLHRLDRETSGVLLFAKDPKSARALTEQFLRRLTQKEYLAIVSGKVRWRTKTVDVPLGKEGLEIKVRQAAGLGQNAVTEFTRLDCGEDSSLLAAMPKTGRLHQIRAHLAHLGHPVLGDKLYTGAGESYMKAVRRELTPEDLKLLGAKRQMLHASILRFKHPATEKPAAVAAPPPQDFIDCLAERGLAVPGRGI